MAICFSATQLLFRDMYDVPVLHMQLQHDAVWHVDAYFKHACQSHFGFWNESRSDDVDAGLVMFCGDATAIKVKKTISK